MFPDEILLPFLPTSDEATEPKGKAASASKGKIKKIDSYKKGKEKVPMPTFETAEDLDFESTPSPPLAKKKRKTTSASKKGKTKMTIVEISHYYSSFKEEKTPSPPVHAQKQARVSSVKATMQLLFEAMDADSESEDSDVSITKEIHTGSSRTL